MMLQVVDAGPFTTIQDLGRVGRAHQGVARSGAADQGSRALGNRLVGNTANAAVLEITVGPASFVVRGTVLLAVTGATAAVVLTTNDGVTAEAAGNIAFVVNDGTKVRVGPARDGLRAYVAVRGGFDEGIVLGSRSYDSLGRIGPPPLIAGQLLAIGRDGAGPPWFEVVPLVPPQRPTAIDVLLGPRDDWLLATEVDRLLSTEWTVGVDSDRTGTRLTGAELRRRPGELPTEAMIPGAVQLPMDGHPIILGPDCGTTGGYPVIAVVSRTALDRVGQLRPGDGLRFHLTSRRGERPG